LSKEVDVVIGGWGWGGGDISGGTSKQYTKGRRGVTFLKRGRVYQVEIPKRSLKAEPVTNISHVLGEVASLTEG
jgi:hypothetical protein